MLFVIAEYWVFLMLALVAGLGFGWWRASPAGRAANRVGNPRERG